MIAVVLLEAETLLGAPGVEELLLRIHHEGRLVGLVSLAGPAAIADVRGDFEIHRRVHVQAHGPRALEEATAATGFGLGDTVLVAGSEAALRAATDLSMRAMGLTTGGPEAAARLVAAGAIEVHESPMALCRSFDDSLLASKVLSLSDQNTG